MTRMFEGEPLDRKRSLHMAKIRGKNTRPEVALRRALSSQGVRYRLHKRTVPGIPDICHEGAKVAVFVDGCFWHGCPDHYTAPKTRKEYWQAKVRRNLERRNEVRQQLAGWHLFEAYECDLRVRGQSIAQEIANAIQRGSNVAPRNPRKRRPKGYLAIPR